MKIRKKFIELREGNEKSEWVIVKSQVEIEGIWEQMLRNFGSFNHSWLGGKKFIK